VGTTARPAPERAACRRGNRVVASGRRLQSCAGQKGGSETGPSPVDRARNGSKHQLLVDATGLPLAWTVTAGNCNDVTQLVPLVERVPPVRGKPGRPRRRPARVTADRGYDSNALRRQLQDRGIEPEIANRYHGHGSGLGSVRWVVERTFAWLHHFKRLLVRYDRRAEIHEAFLAIGCCLVCFRRLQNSF
jgi:transposase